MAKLTHRMVNTNGINMHIVEQGAGPVVLLLHGFPGFWYSWRYQIPALAEAGFRAVAPDLRGFGQSDKPKNADDYTTLHVVGDLVGLLDELGEQRVWWWGMTGVPLRRGICACFGLTVWRLLLSWVPYLPRTPAGSVVRTMGGVCGEGFYMCRFEIFNKP